MTVAAIIQARLNSTRLPRKVLAEIEGRPLIDHVVERALAIGGVGEVFLNVPTADYQEIMPAVRHREGSRFYIIHTVNQEQDVLGSYRRIAEVAQADVVMRLTGDCPLLAPDLSGEVLRYFLEQQPDYCANTNPPTTWADGWDTEVFTYEALKRSDQPWISPYARQHVTTMIKQQGACLYGPKAPHDWTQSKMSVDTAEDLGNVRKLYAHMKRHGMTGLGWKTTDKALTEVNSYVGLY